MIRKGRQKRVSISIRLEPRTIKDMLLLGEKMGFATLSQVHRYLIHTGFKNLGNWRKL